MEQFISDESRERINQRIDQQDIKNQNEESLGQFADFCVNQEIGDCDSYYRSLAGERSYLAEKAKNALQVAADKLECTSQITDAKIKERMKALANWRFINVFAMGFLIVCTVFLTVSEAFSTYMIAYHSGNAIFDSPENGKDFAKIFCIPAIGLSLGLKFFEGHISSERFRRQFRYFVISAFIICCIYWCYRFTQIFANSFGGSLLSMLDAQQGKPYDFTFAQLLLSALGSSICTWLITDLSKTIPKRLVTSPEYLAVKQEYREREEELMKCLEKLKEVNDKKVAYTAFREETKQRIELRWKEYQRKKETIKMIQQENINALNQINEL